MASGKELVPETFMHRLSRLFCIGGVVFVILLSFDYYQTGSITRDSVLQCGIELLLWLPSYAMLEHIVVTGIARYWNSRRQ